MPPVISVVGCSDAGKTTLLEKLIPELRRRGLKVAVIKHDVHGFDLDVPGKDTWRLGRAGADVVAISSPDKVAIIERVEVELSLDTLAERLAGVDLILTEGYKRGNKPKIEVHRAELGRELLCGPEDNLLAVASDEPVETGVPVFDLNNVADLAAFIVERLCLPPS
ncbi:MAG: molybdopterin-guanine dinucleotide biosynthesis protein B [Clostridia bacterium]|nr:MAG: molybdopterin-guanine dinucleotide biosynthesis protein B [Clostridia bacterium]